MLKHAVARYTLHLIFSQYKYNTMYNLASNKCEWLMYRTTEKCNKNCVGHYCAVHNAQIKRGIKTFPCDNCKRGINHLGTCYKCNYISKRKKM